MKKLPLPTATYWHPFHLGALFLFFLSLSSCQNNRYRDFNPEEIVNVPEAQLKSYADTAATFERLNSYRDRKKVDSLLYFAEALRNYREDIAQVYAQMAFDISTEKNWKYPKAISAHRLAVLKEIKAKYSEDIEDAMVDANISKRIFDQTDREDWKAWVYSLIGRLHYRRNNIDSAQYYFTSALEQLDIASIPNETKMIFKAGILHDIANTYDPQEPKKFIEIIQKSDSLFKVLEFETDRARIWIDLGQFYLNQGEYYKADSLFLLSLQYGNKNNDTDLLIKAYQQKGYLSAIKYYYYKEEKYSTEALADFNRCLELQREGRYKTFDLLGWLYSTKTSYQEHWPYLDTALIYYKFAIEEARKEGALNALKLSSLTVANLCGFEDEWKRCQEILDTSTVAFLNSNYAGVVDTITKHSKAAYQRTNQVEQREIVVSATRKRQNLLFTAGVIFVIAGLIFLLILQRQQKRRLQARMEALRAQINPHFFSNSLNAIESLVNMDKKQEASKYIIHFSRLSRQILSRSRNPNTSLQEELKMMKHFLELEKLRFRDKLNYEITVAPDLNPEQIEVPGLILQPYAENAILHGIKPKPGPGNLRIEVKKDSKKLICIIEDDGIGRKASAKIKAALMEQRKSMGMNITKERIQKMGKVKGQNLEIIDLLGDQGEALGTRVILQIPLKYRKLEY